MIGTKLQAEEIRDIEAKVFGYPKRGVHVGGGKHVDLEHPNRLGWTLWENQVVLVAKDQYEIVPTVTQKEVDSSSAVTPTERAKLRAVAVAEPIEEEPILEVKR
jgi:hypothetical protein